MIDLTKSLQEALAVARERMVERDALIEALVRTVKALDRAYADQPERHPAAAAAQIVLDRLTAKA